jgi:hypothetical protein
MANLSFNADSKSNLASYITAGQVIFTEDNLYLVKTDGSKIKYSSIEVVSSLPSTNISSDKIYILKDGVNYSLHYFDTEWRILSSSIGIDDTNLSTTSTYSSDKILSLINNQGDYNTSYSYNGDGKINGYTITGDKTESVTYTYFTSGENLGKIETETIIKDGKTLVNTFSYTNGKISGVITVTN